MQRPQLIAHRGYPKHYPENTREGLAAAIEAGARGIEFDVQLTADGVPVLLHDATLERTTDATGSVLDLPWAALEEVSAGEPARFGSRFAAARIPRLAQVLELLERRGASAFIEIKPQSLQRLGRAAVLEAVFGALAGRRVDYCLISFDAEALTEARRLGAAEIGWILPRYDAAERRKAERLAPRYLFCNHTRLPETVDTLWPGPWRWALYDVTDPERALALAARGAALIATFAVGEMLRHPAWRPGDLPGAPTSR